MFQTGHPIQWIFKSVIGVLITGWIFIMAGPAPINAACSKNPCAEGFATIFNNDVETAREAAIDAARIKVVKPLGIIVDTETIYSMGLKIADWNRIKYAGYIVHDEVIEEEQKDGGYWVKIQAWIKNKPVRDEVDRQLLDNHKILMITDGVGSWSVEQQLKPLLSEWGYRYLDNKFVKSNLADDTWTQLKNRQLYALNPDAYKFMADLILYIKSSVRFAEKDQFFSWYNGNTTISLYQISGDKKGEPQIVVDKNSTKLVTARDKKNGVQTLVFPGNNHPNSFKKLVALPAVNDFMKQMTGSKVFGTSSRPIVITLTDVPASGEYHKFLYKLKAQKGVESGSLQELSQDHTTYKLSVNYRLKSIYLAYLLTADQAYAVNRYDWQGIELQFQKPLKGYSE